MKLKISEKVNAAMVLLYVWGGNAIAGGLPSINAPGATAGAATDPFSQIVTLMKWTITVIVYVVLAFLFITVIKNAWQKYHQLGEEGSKATWRDLGTNVIVGAVLVALGIAFGNYAMDILGKSSVN